ncbi:MAG: tetraacyldisaccharide 4'-kinase, partial [Terriglobales bacterium]
SLPGVAPVISIGNLTVGGTGKTPVTIDLARRLSEKNLKVAVLSRGYERKSAEPQVVVSDGSRLLATCEDAGDEPFLIARSVPSAVVISGSDRVATGARAVTEFGAQVILLDDGFQHIRLKRSFDIVLIDYNDDLECDALLPAGRLREPLSALGRATSIVITKVPVGCDSDRIMQISSIIRKHNKRADISYCQFKPSCSENLKGERVLALCGIARPEQFLDSINQLGGTVVKSCVYPDHHWYTEQEIETLDSLVRKNKATCVVTTEKDYVRIAKHDHVPCPIVTVRQEANWLGEIPHCIDYLTGKTAPPPVPSAR